MSCPAKTPEICAQICPPPPLPPPCYVKPIMRGLHRQQTKNILFQAIVLSCLAGTGVYVFLGSPRREKYKSFYARAEFEDWADEMARKGLFQAVPKESLTDNKHMKGVPDLGHSRP